MADNNLTGPRKPPGYHVWKAMKGRCLNPANPAFCNYGGRGIVVCDRWLHSFQNFISDMGVCPPGFTLERIDNNGPYSPDNCKYATRTEQANNKRNNLIFAHAGKTQTLPRWAIETEIGYHTLYRRIHDLGWSIERAFTEPVTFAAAPSPARRSSP